MTYNGYTCLVQISAYHENSEIKTYVLDVLNREVAESFAEVLGASLFENGKVLKILHGCISSDLTWLIRDFGIKLVGTFDTQEFHRKYIGSKDLSLAHFWQRYCEGIAQIELDEKKEL